MTPDVRLIYHLAAMKRLILMALAVLAAIAVVVALTAQERGVSPLSAGSTPTPTTFIAPAPSRQAPTFVAPVAIAPPPEAIDGGFEVPLLTSAEEAAAKEILENDPRAQALLGGHSYFIREIGPWIDADHNKIGVSMMLRLAEPVAAASMVGDWFSMDYDGLGPYGYQEMVDPITQEHVEQYLADAHVQTLSALVDLRREALVELDPSFERPDDDEVAPVGTFAP